MKYINSRKKKFTDKYYEFVIDTYLKEIKIKNFKYENLGKLLFSIIISDIIFNFAKNHHLIINKKNNEDNIRKYIHEYIYSNSNINIKNLISFSTIDISQFKELFLYPGEFIDYLCQVLTEREYFIKNNNLKFNIIKKNRNNKGVFFTPYEIARNIFILSFNKYKNKNNITSILDPACGSCVFLSAASHFLLEKGYKKDDIIKIIYGFDINEFFFKIGFLIIQLELKYKINEVINNKPHNFYELDFIKLRFKNSAIQQDLFKNNITNIKENYDIIIMNPPYDRLKPDLLNNKEKKITKKIIAEYRSNNYFSLTNIGSLDHYRFFIEQVLKILHDSSTFSAIVPKSLIGDLNNKNLRQYLINNNLLDTLIIVSEKDKLFKNVNQAFVIFLIKKNKIRKNILIQNYNYKKNVKINKLPINFIKNNFSSSFIIPNIDKEGQKLFLTIAKYEKIKNLKFILNHRGEIDLTLDKEIYKNGSSPFYRGRDITSYKSKYTDYANINTLIKNKPKKFSDTQQVRIVGQQIANMDSKQRLKFSIVGKKSLVANSLNYLIVNKNQFYISSYVLLAILNSVLLDWRFRVTSSNNHINNYEIDDLSINININKKDIDKLNLYVKQILKNYNNSIRKKIELIVIKIFKADKFLNYLIKNHPNGEILK